MSLNSNMLLFFVSSFIFVQFSLHAQTSWKSTQHHYMIEVPEGFVNLDPVGINVDFKAGNGNSSIIVVVTSLPEEYVHYSIWEIMGDLSTYEVEWEQGAKEYFDSPDFLKYGKSEVDGQDALWYDYTTANPKTYSKIYQVQKSGKIYTFTLSSDYNARHEASALWYRFKNRIKFL